MGKYLVEANYIGTGINGLIREGGSKRRGAVEDLFKSVGGRLESFYYAFGEHDVLVIGELPDDATAMSLALQINSSGAVVCRVTVLVAPEEMDVAVKKTATYRAPGADLAKAEIANWDNEGGHQSQLQAPDANGGA